MYINFDIRLRVSKPDIFRENIDIDTVIYDEVVAQIGIRPTSNGPESTLTLERSITLQIRKVILEYI